MSALQTPPGPPLPPEPATPAARPAGDTLLFWLSGVAAAAGIVVNFGWSAVSLVFFLPFNINTRNYEFATLNLIHLGILVSSTILALGGIVALYSAPRWATWLFVAAAVLVVPFASSGWSGVTWPVLVIGPPLTAAVLAGIRDYRRRRQ